MFKHRDDIIFVNIIQVYSELGNFPPFEMNVMLRIEPTFAQQVQMCGVQMCMNDVQPICRMTFFRCETSVTITIGSLFTTSLCHRVCNDINYVRPDRVRTEEP